MNNKTQIISKIVVLFFIITAPKHSTSQWTQLGLDIDRESSNDFSGYSVSMDAAGNRLAIVATRNRGNGINAGHVRMYERSTMGWVQLRAEFDGEAMDDYSGFPVSIDSMGDRLAICATLNDGNGVDAGHVRVYEWNSSGSERKRY